MKDGLFERRRDGSGWIIWRRAFLAATAAVLLAAVYGCGRQVSAPRTSPTAKNQPTSKSRVTPNRSQLRMVTSGVKELSWQAGGKYIMRARAKDLTADEATGRAQLTQAQAVLYEEGKDAAVLSANLVEADMSAGTLTAKGGIAAKSLIRNVEITAKQLVWMNRQNRLIGTGGISVKSDAGGLSADRLEADTALKQVTLYSDKGGSASLNAAALEGSL